MVLFAGTVRDPKAVVEMGVTPTEVALRELENPIIISTTPRPTEPTRRPSPPTPAVSIQTATETTTAGNLTQKYLVTRAVAPSAPVFQDITPFNY